MPKQLKAAIIWWVDSCTDSSRWTDEPTDIAYVMSIGFVISANRKCVVLGMSADLEEHHTKWCCTKAIPRGCIKKIKYIKAKDWVRKCEE